MLLSNLFSSFGFFIFAGAGNQKVVMERQKQMFEERQVPCQGFRPGAALSCVRRLPFSFGVSSAVPVKQQRHS